MAQVRLEWLERKPRDSSHFVAPLCRVAPLSLLSEHGLKLLVKAAH